MSSFSLTKVNNRGVQNRFRLWGLTGYLCIVIFWTRFINPTRHASRKSSILSCTERYLRYRILSRSNALHTIRTIKSNLLGILLRSIALHTIRTYDIRIRSRSAGPFGGSISPDPWDFFEGSGKIDPLFWPAYLLGPIKVGGRRLAIRGGLKLVGPKNYNRYPVRQHPCNKKSTH